MTRVDYPEPLKRLAVQLRRLPGIGPRSAERIALWLLGGRVEGSRSAEVAEAITEAAARVRPCPQCGFLTDTPRCSICSDDSRAGGPLCVVEQSTDILPLERTGVFRGRYHALGGKLSPLDHVGPDDLAISALVARCRSTSAVAEGAGTSVEPPPAEVVLALGADVEGEATARYLADVLRAECPGLRVTRIAQGLPAGGGLESADELTLSRALTGRRELDGCADEESFFVLPACSTPDRKAGINRCKSLISSALAERIPHNGRGWSLPPRCGIEFSFDGARILFPPVPAS